MYREKGSRIIVFLNKIIKLAKSEFHIVNLLQNLLQNIKKISYINKNLSY
jgi:hypothetical protein